MILTNFELILGTGILSLKKGPHFNYFLEALFDVILKHVQLKYETVKPICYPNVQYAPD